MQRIVSIRESSQAVLTSIDALDVAFEKAIQSLSKREVLTLQQARANLLKNPNELLRERIDNLEHKIIELQAKTVELTTQTSRDEPINRGEGTPPVSEGVAIAEIERVSAKEENETARLKILVSLAIGFAGFVALATAAPGSVSIKFP